MQIQTISISKQSGSVLITGLMIVITLTLLVLSASRTTTLQQKMSVNLRERDLAFQAAETALLAGEKYIRDTEPLPVFGDTGESQGRYNFLNTRAFISDDDWASLSSVSFGSTLHQTTNPPEYILEKISFIDTEGESLDSSTPIVSNHYRITSRAKNHNATVVIQGIYRR